MIGIAVLHLCPEVIVEEPDFRLTSVFLLNGSNRIPPVMTGKFVHIVLMSLGDGVIERLDPSYDVFLLTSKSRERQHRQDC